MTLVVALFACSPEEVADGSGPEVEDTQPPAAAPRPVGRPSGSCPAWDTPGTQTFTSNGVDREIEAFWPTDHVGPIGLLFAWHGLGDRADNFASALDLEAFAEANDILVVVPWSENPDLLTWNYIGGGGNDVALFEDVRNCGVTDFAVDPTRVWSVGFSFGALWTTFLTLNASDVLAGTVTFSGGTGDSVQLDYFSPLSPIPVLAAWGGENDLFNAGIFTVEFAEASQAFADALEADGHVVVRCDHGLGHTIPFQGTEIVENFLLTEVFGQPSLYADGNVNGLPDYCTGANPNP